MVNLCEFSLYGESPSTGGIPTETISPGLAIALAESVDMFGWLALSLVTTLFWGGVFGVVFFRRLGVLPIELDVAAPQKCPVLQMSRDRQSAAPVCLEMFVVFCQTVSLKETSAREGSGRIACA